MNTVSRSRLIAFVICVAIGINATTQSNVGAAESMSSYPSGSVVLRRSDTAMQRLLHAVHAEGRIQQRISHLAAQLQVTGDCLMAPRAQSFQFWSRGSSFVNGTRGDVSSHYISILRRTWLRSPATHNTWQRADADQGAMLGIILCPAFFMFWPGMARLAASAQNLGTVVIGARTMWHIRVHGAHDRMSFYIDQRSYNWVRLVSESHGPPLEHAVYDYSRFNETVSIKAPQIGASRP